MKKKERNCPVQCNDWKTVNIGSVWKYKLQSDSTHIIASSTASIDNESLKHCKTNVLCSSVESINRGARQHSPQLPGGSWRSSAQIFHLSPKIEARQILKVAGNPPSLPG